MRRFPKGTDIPEFRIFAKLGTPEKVQDFLNALPINFELDGETSLSPLSALKERKAHCMEGAQLAAAIFWYHGQAPLVMNLRTTGADVRHAVALFGRVGRWGAVSKTNHAALRYRDTVYASVRELAMSYFNEYFKDSGKKTMRGYSKPLNLLRFGTRWLTSEDGLWSITYAIEDAPHDSVAGRSSMQKLRKADPVEIDAGKLVEWARNGRRRRAEEADRPMPPIRTRRASRGNP